MMRGADSANTDRVQLDFVRELDRVEMNHDTYAAIEVGYRTVVEQFGARLVEADLALWRDQILALRRFGMLHAYDEPIGAREVEFRTLERVGFPHPSAHILVLIVRCVYLVELGDDREARDALRALKALAASHADLAPEDIVETIAELEGRLPREP